MSLCVAYLRRHMHKHSVSLRGFAEHPVIRSVGHAEASGARLSLAVTLDPKPETLNPNTGP